MAGAGRDHAEKMQINWNARPNEELHKGTKRKEGGLRAKRKRVKERRRMNPKIPRVHGRPHIQLLLLLLALVSCEQGSSVWSVTAEYHSEGELADDGFPDANEAVSGNGCCFQQGSSDVYRADPQYGQACDIAVGSGPLAGLEEDTALDSKPLAGLVWDAARIQALS
ncbi:hypothetical protein H920_19661 [Fukomys damarensis]|uniref:Uncharacterized protein n=1 Tax=Fukomys damarensis TaxID=885580 RepID=A0A091CM35_FUKDA|nr:hypothetical protein H920_19661 [Fukomys damarensis]